MGAGATIPEPLRFAEIEAWARLLDTRPTPWEIKTLLSMDEAWRAAHGGKEATAARRHQGVGDYCKGEHVEGCRKTYGAALERVCSTCPS